MSAESSVAATEDESDSDQPLNLPNVDTVTDQPNPTPSTVELFQQIETQKLTNLILKSKIASIQQSHVKKLELPLSIDTACYSRSEPSSQATTPTPDFSRSLSNSAAHSPFLLSSLHDSTAGSLKAKKTTSSSSSSSTTSSSSSSSSSSRRKHGSVAKSGRVYGNEKFKSSKPHQQIVSSLASGKTPKSALLERRRKAVFELLRHEIYPSGKLIVF